MIKKKRLMMLVLTLAIQACVAGPANYDDEPNAIQRANVLHKNRLGISVEHSTWGKKIAFRFADEHCDIYHKIPVYKGTSLQYGPDVISTWTCE